MKRGEGFSRHSKGNSVTGARALPQIIRGNKTLRGIFGSVYPIILIGRLIYRECGLPCDSHYGSSYSTLETILIELYCAGYNKPRLAPSRTLPLVLLPPSPPPPPRPPVFLPLVALSRARCQADRQINTTQSLQTQALLLQITRRERGPAL